MVTMLYEREFYQEDDWENVSIEGIFGRSDCSVEKE
jgi:hypothetical protein